ncbi:macrophage-expressed gene 1 protein-like [Mizuhopecten yessoensis]|uniref:Macrophage-expressed gene 1 protein n=1 Tax=Mizuhopecten yessoensis TaxID=6573 RepID=A0A210PLN0_MIZYE|nr:macrophage-expressed gene 1 protein-like [Mizuhopecten yessoensis]OWF37402.1 Macrophage-expressed gene 1 protein [Mizuhopecten yessoensis]
MEKSVLSVCLLAALGIVLCMSSLDAALVTNKYEDNLPIGSPSWCIDKLQSLNLHHFEVLPGAGWDNLENKARGQVIKRTYYECRTTDDGKFLLPDGVITTPVKSSKLNVFSKIYSSWMEYKETTSESINVAANFHNEFFSIDGMFSTESQSVKENQIGQNTSIVRTQARYVKYTANLQPDTPFHPTFRARVMEIAKLIQTNETAVARYESQRLVRDFGTHVLTGLDAGAVIAQIQHVSSKFVKNNDEKTTRRMASLSTSFSFSPNGTNSSLSEQELKEFSNSVEHSTIKTYGGPSYQPNTFKLDTWAEGLDDNLVAVDKEGTPLYYFITASAFPELPNYIVPGVFNHIYQAVYLYYKFNTYRGCTDANKPNFNRKANVEDGTCTPPSTNFTFGGVYQTCTQDSVLKPDHCSEYIKKNPLTDDMTCPSGYSSVLLDNSDITKTDTTRECHKVWYKLWIGQKCTDVPVSGSLHVNSYWCGATGNVQQHSGYMFGGLFTPNVGNPMTGGSTCPPNFYGLPLNDGLTICLTQDFDAGFTYAAPFGGFFTCHTGNPLATSGKTDPSQWSKSCPRGFSNHLALVSKNCEIEYCAVTRTISDKGLPSLRKPPFMTYPGYRNTEMADIFIDTKSNTWTKLPSNMLKVQDATLDLETAKLVFRNNPEFEEQMQLINIPTMQMTYANTSSESDNLNISTRDASINVETTIQRENAPIRRLNADSSPDLENSPASKEHQNLPNGMVAALSVVTTLLCVCIVVIVAMYRRRRERGSGETQTLLG